MNLIEGIAKRNFTGLVIVAFSAGVYLSGFIDVPKHVVALTATVKENEDKALKRYDELIVWQAQSAEQTEKFMRNLSDQQLQLSAIMKYLMDKDPDWRPRVPAPIAYRR